MNLKSRKSIVANAIADIDFLSAELEDKGLV